jgi:hypothetical protein
MRKLLLLSASLLMLTACSKTVRYNLEFNLPDKTLQQQLSAAAVRVIENRMLGMQKKLISSDIADVDGKTMLTVKVSDAEGAKILTDSLLTPFTMTVMTQVDPGMGDISNEKYGDFKETSLETKHFESVTPRAMDDGKGSVVITFTDEGKEILKKIYKEKRGQTIGIFVRGVLMSKKTIDAKDTQDMISVDGIPTPGIAKIFADDVNVGLHVRFSEAQ